MCDVTVDYQDTYTLQVWAEDSKVEVEAGVAEVPKAEATNRGVAATTDPLPSPPHPRRQVYVQT